MVIIDQRVDMAASDQGFQLPVRGCQQFRIRIMVPVDPNHRGSFQQQQVRCQFRHPARGKSDNQQFAVHGDTA